MKLKILQAMLAGWLLISQTANAQVDSPRPVQDHPSHRYLPPPVGKRLLKEQIDSLQRLQSEEAAEQPAAPMQLSPSQLKQLDSILESFRDEKGELNLPTPDQIPKQWIENFLPDPKQRAQAKKMLEQYSRSRNLPMGQSPNGLPPIDTEPGANNSTSENNKSAANSNQPSNGNQQPSRNQPRTGTNSKSGLAEPNKNPLSPGDTPNESSGLTKLGNRVVIKTLSCPRTCLPS